MHRSIALTTALTAALLVASPAAAGAAPPGPEVTFSCGTALHPPGIFHTVGAPGSLWLGGVHYVMVSLDAPGFHQSFGTKTGLLDDSITCVSPSGNVVAVIVPTP